MSRTSFVVLGWLVVTIGLMVLHAGCGSKPATNTPVRRDIAEPVWCVIGEMVDGTSGMFCANRERVCDIVRGKAEETGADTGLVGLSDCTAVYVSLTPR